MKFTVYQSNDHKFKYFDEKKVNACKDFQPSMQHINMSFEEFVKRLQNWKEGDKRY
jgi:hypoxia-inducible factor 1-alpha inhibitor (HIF hydroxylase)